MGKEFIVNSLEDMCDLMCGNKIPEGDSKFMSGLYECFHCLQNTVIWDADFDFSDYGEEGEGVIHECHCTNCGAQITYRVPNVQEGD